METETIDCIHEEGINSATHVGTCRLCGQQRWYDPIKEGNVRLLKRGRIRGVLTNVVPSTAKGVTSSHRRWTSTDIHEKPKEEGLPKAPEEVKVATEEVKVTADTVVPDLSKWGNAKKGRFYDKHRDEILADLAKLGAPKLRKKWQMSSPGWIGMKKRWRAQGIVIVDPGEIGPSGPQKHPHRERKMRTLEDWEKVKDEMIADHKVMRVLDFLKKWHIDGKRWHRLKEAWGVKPKQKGKKPPEPAAAEETPDELLREPRDWDEACKELAKARLAIEWYRGYRQHVLDTNKE